MKITKIFAINLILILTVGCTGVDNKFDWKKPVSLNMQPPQGPYNYQKGWQDGCNSGLSSTNNSLHLALGSYKFNLDNNLKSEPLYNKAWQYAYNHCGYSMKSLARYGL